MLVITKTKDMDTGLKFRNKHSQAFFIWNRNL